METSKLWETQGGKTVCNTPSRYTLAQTNQFIPKQLNITWCLMVALFTFLTLMLFVKFHSFCWHFC